MTRDADVAADLDSRVDAGVVADAEVATDADVADGEGPTDAGSTLDVGVSSAPPDPGATDATACQYTDYPTGTDPADLPATGEDADGVESDVWDALYGVEDPEMPISVVDLGLVYGVDVEDGHCTVELTLTYTGCPARNMLLGDVEAAAAGVEGVESADVRLVWSPEWSVEMVTDAGRDDLREFGLSV